MTDTKSKTQKIAVTAAKSVGEKESPPRDRTVVVAEADRRCPWRWSKHFTRVSHVEKMNIVHVDTEVSLVSRLHICTYLFQAFAGVYSVFPCRFVSRTTEQSEIFYSSIIFEVRSTFFLQGTLSRTHHTPPAAAAAAATVHRSPTTSTGIYTWMHDHEAVGIAGFQCTRTRFYEVVLLLCCAANNPFPSEAPPPSLYSLSFSSCSRNQERPHLFCMLRSISYVVDSHIYR